MRYWIILLTSRDTASVPLCHIQQASDGDPALGRVLAGDQGTISLHPNSYLRMASLSGFNMQQRRPLAPLSLPCAKRPAC